MLGTIPEVTTLEPVAVKGQVSCHNDNTISELVREQAVEWSDLFWKNHARQQKQALQQSRQLNASSWQIVRQPELSIEQYQTALDMVVEANTLRPDCGMYLNTLGAAQYRARKYKDPLATLSGSEKLNAPDFDGDPLMTSCSLP